MVYHCTLERAQDGLFIASFPDLPSIQTFGETKEEALIQAENALNSCIETDVSRGILPSRPSYKGSDSYEIEVSPHIVVAIQLRELRGKTSQTEIAEKLNITYQTYQNLENPIKGNPTIKKLEKVAKAFGKSIQISFV